MAMNTRVVLFLALVLLAALAAASPIPGLKQARIERRATPVARSFEGPYAKARREPAPRPSKRDEAPGAKPSKYYKRDEPPAAKPSKYYKRDEPPAAKPSKYYKY